jgi:hypoxanthine-DNA glycosylase
MPGIRSLEAAQYYAHPQNAFWKVMGELFGAPVDTYAQRVALIKKNNLALWDVLKCCQRTGSLDSSIDDDTIEVNDFAAFLSAHPKITRIFFNGAKAEKEFLKRVLPQLPDKIRARITLARLPSTSPAHAGISLAGKVRAWRAVRDA